MLNNEKKKICTLYSDKRGRWNLPHFENILIIRFEKEGYNFKSVSKTDLNPITRLLEKKLIGYLNKLWFNREETAEIYINSSKEFNIQLLRFGLEVEEIDKLSVDKCHVQQVPDGNFVEFGLNWKNPIRYKFDVNLSSGLYGFRLTNLDNTEQYTINFILSPPIKANTGERKFLVLSSTNNWQANNIWGGRSRYRNFESPNKKKFKIRCKHFLVKYFPDRFINLL